MNKLSKIFAIVMLLSTFSLYGQQMQTTIMDEPQSFPGFIPKTALPLTQMDFHKGVSTQALQQLYYFNVNIPALFWNIPFNTTINSTAAQIISMSQLFTQPTSAGTLDSAWIYIFRLPLGNIRFDIMRDTLRTLGNGNTYHLPAYSSAIGLIDSSEVTFLDVDSTKFTTVKFNGMVLPKNFFFTARPATVGGITSAFTLLTDSRLGQAADFSTDAARTASIFTLATGGWGLMPLYGAFQWGPSGKDTARNPMMWAVAWITPDEGAAVTPSRDASGLTLYQNYPNPVSSMQSRTYIKFELAQAGMTTLDVYDAVGRKVATMANEYMAPGSYSKTLEVGKLPAGYYSYRITNAGKVLSRSFLVLK
jgi:hypothetical protein